MASNMDKFASYYNTDEKIQELSEYVHLNFNLIQTKMVSEMRRKLKLTPDLINSDGYVSLLVSLYGRMFNELTYGLAGICQTFEMDVKEIIPPATFNILFQLIEGHNPLGGKIRTDLNHISQEERDSYYLRNIEELRRNLDALPK
jgi:hypothetical protein